MKIDIISVQPGMFRGFLEQSIVARAVKKGACEICVRDLRDFAHDRRRTVDDKPYGGGPGMLMKCEPWFEAVETCLGGGTARVVMTSPAGRRFTERDAESLAQAEHVIFMCGHYEGFDARIGTLATDRFSIGDFVMTGGELAAAAMVDATVRLLPGVLGGGPAATAHESFGRDGLLEAPQYTRPPVFRGMAVPQVLIDGDHNKADAWKSDQARRLTEAVRPDMVAELSSSKRRDAASSSRAVVSLGSNVEPRADYLRKALAALALLPETRLVRASTVRETEPVDVPAEFAHLKFLNQAAVFETTLEVHDFARRMHAVEDMLGRVRTVRNGPRTIDIDLIDFDGLHLDESDLTLPHPRAKERAFVLEPLAELGITP